YREISRERREVRDSAGAVVPALLFEFVSSDLHSPPELVLASYLINGRYVNDTASARGYNVRSPGVFSRQLAYVARIQVTTRASGDRPADVALLTDFAGRVFGVVSEMMPQIEK